LGPVPYRRYGCACLARLVAPLDYGHAVLSVPGVAAGEAVAAERFAQVPLVLVPGLWPATRLVGL